MRWLATHGGVLHFNQFTCSKNDTEWTILLIKLNWIIYNLISMSWNGSADGIKNNLIPVSTVKRLFSLTGTTVSGIQIIKYHKLISSLWNIMNKNNLMAMHCSIQWTWFPELYKGQFTLVLYNTLCWIILIISHQFLLSQLPCQDL